ncbi:MAG TPA: hypothetical protein VF278_04215 [Pirellulales bacterium]
MNDRKPLQPTDVFWSMIALLAVLNLLSPLFTPMADKAWLVAPFIGLLLGQWNWLAVWAVFGPTPWKSRLAEVLGGMFALALGLYIGWAMHDQANLSALPEALGMLPVAMLATQSPLWVIRFFFAWRIRAECHTPDAAADEARRFDLRHIFAATAVVAGCLGVARGAGVPTEALLSILVGLPIISILTAIPCICTGIVVGDLWAANMLLAVYTLLLPGVLVAVSSMSLDPGPPLEAIASLCGFMCGMSAVVHVGLRWIRAAGFTMTAPRRRYPGVIKES